MDPETELVDAAALRDEDEAESSVDDDGLRLSAALDQKANDVLEACRWKDTTRLRQLAESGGGFIRDDLRQLAWPILLGLTHPSSDKKSGKAQPTTEDDVSSDLDWRDLLRHRDENQVQLDVNRSFIYYPNDKSDAEIDKRKQELSCLIVEVLRRNPYLCYFQGYHDICQVFLLVLQPEIRARMVARLSILRIRDFMLPSLGPTTVQLKLLPDVLALADPQLRRHIAGIEPYYALAGTLTMYSHNIEGYHDIARMFDIILAREPVFTIYMFAQIIIDRRKEILDIDERDLLQVILGRVPSRMDLDSLIKKASGLFEQHPPETLPSWGRISPSSVLKTARDVDLCAKQTLDDGYHYFKKQASEVYWDEMRTRMRTIAWAYRRTFGMVGMAVAVGFIAMHVRRNPSSFSLVRSFLHDWKKW